VPTTYFENRREWWARHRACVGTTGWLCPPTIYNGRMKRDEAISRLRERAPDLKRLGVEHLYMFGSMARDEARDDSDIDLFFDYQKGKLGLFDLMDVREIAAQILGRPTDIVTRDSLHQTLRQRIEAAALQVF
jgi:predicted nucleotidyltransferase